jgi:hypothetical protein
MVWFGRRVHRCSCSVLVSTALLVSAVPASAVRDRVVLGEVSARHAAPTARAFRRVVAEELRALEVRPAHGEGYVLSASLVSLDASAQDDAATATCIVSATLRSEGRGALVATLRGRVRASDVPSEVEAVKLDAMRAAVRSAVRGVPEAIRAGGR